MMCDRCAELEEEIAYLKSELGQVTSATIVGRLQVRFRLRPQEARMLEILHRTHGRIIDQYRLAEMLDSSSESGKLITALVWRIRHQMGHDTLQTIWSRGFVLSPEAYALVDDAIKGATSAQQQTEAA